jgi:hypothetical protein
MQEFRTAVHNKQKILDSVQSYYQWVTIAVKHRNTCGFIVLDPSYSYHNELQFQEGKWAQDLASADAAINQSINSINAKYASYSQTEYTRILTENAALASDIVSIKQQIILTKSQLEHSKTAPKRLTEQILLSETNHNTEMILESTEHSLMLEKQGLNDAILLQAQSCTQKTRAALIEGIHSTDGIEYIVNQIFALGVDTTELAYLAIKGRNATLLNMAISHGATLDSALADGKTLIHHSLLIGNQDIIDISLKNTINFDAILLSIIQNGDSQSLDLLLTHEPVLAYKLLSSGNTILQHAMLHDNFALFQDLISKHSNLVHVANFDGETPFKTALILDLHPKYIEVISQHTNIDVECRMLLDNGDIYLIEQAASFNAAASDFVSHNLNYTDSQLDCIAEDNMSVIGHYKDSSSDVYSSI